MTSFKSTVFLNVYISPRFQSFYIEEDTMTAVTSLQRKTMGSEEEPDVMAPAAAMNFIEKCTFNNALTPAEWEQPEWSMVKVIFNFRW